MAKVILNISDVMQKVREDRIIVEEAGQLILEAIESSIPDDDNFDEIKEKFAQFADIEVEGPDYNELMEELETLCEENDVELIQ